MFSVSPRNSIEVFGSLFGQSSPTKLLGTSKDPPVVNAICEEHTVDRYTIRELPYFMDERPVEFPPFTKSFDEYRMKPWILLHTSGSTGIPNVIILWHGYYTTIDAFNLFENGSEQQARCGHIGFFTPFPSSHMAEVIWQLPFVILVDSTMVSPPLSPLTPDVANAIHEYGRVEYSILPPSVLNEISKNKEHLRNLGKLEHLFYAGGPLSQASGDIVSPYVRLSQSYGSPEMGVPPMLPKKPKLWFWFRFGSQNTGFEFRKKEGRFLRACDCLKAGARSHASYFCNISRAR